MSHKKSLKQLVNSVSIKMPHRSLNQSSLVSLDYLSFFLHPLVEEKASSKHLLTAPSDASQVVVGGNIDIGLSASSLSKA